MRDTIDMAREAGAIHIHERPKEFAIVGNDSIKAFEALVRADERMSFYGQDKPAECADGCPPNQICDYCQVVAPAKAMILAEREACARLADERLMDTSALMSMPPKSSAAWSIAAAIRGRGNT